MHTVRRSMTSLALALSLAFVPLTAFAAENLLQAGSIEEQATSSDSASQGDVQSSEPDENEQKLQEEKKTREETQAQLKEELDRIESGKQGKTEKAKAQPVEMTLEYDRSDIDEIGTQEQTGHTICCPSFSCAYADAVMDGTVHDHSYYTCSCCTWNDWGGGASVGRCAGTSEELLREAYDQIAAGKPTVIHVAHGGGEHWICLIGYQNAKDLDGLTLDNFVALDPWDGAEITASERYSLYGDGCQHLSSR